MEPERHWRELGWRHPVWGLVRYYRSLRGGSENWLDTLRKDGVIRINADTTFAIDKAHIDALGQYLDASMADLHNAFERFRTEEEANAFCRKLGVKVEKTRTRNKGHHQSSKALIAAVTTIASRVCAKYRVELESDPQRRCVWCTRQGLHVSARNLDGAIPGLLNPAVVWEIKEYWGQTSGGSKMSDAVYECNLVGRELREFEETAAVSVAHIVFLDGKAQWTTRRSDVVRFLDLFHQGLIDYLMVGRDVEGDWEPLLTKLIS